MKCYICWNVSQVGITFILKAWRFKYHKQPTMVVINSKGEVEYQDEFPMIQTYGIGAYPFTDPSLPNVEIQITPTDIIPGIFNGVKIEDEKYILFYGGTNQVFGQYFADHANIQIKSLLKETKNISLKLHQVNHIKAIASFWTGLQNMFFIKMQLENDPVLKKIQRLLSCNNGNGWALLCKGSNMVVSGYVEEILKFLIEHSFWKSKLIMDRQPSEVCLTDYLQELRRTKFCHRFDIPYSRCVPEMKCPDCQRFMEIWIKLKCCHGENGLC
ncbi:Protein SIEVE ELEMENT OCCLUSION B [Quillaja saponaria]|uniref:Protein SIEVE ELEMENT OCCLUSION B n=1 Tax=Quillaja saponaria TaxID=32244 RepID=A0AAD7VN25_QUISA|nr:Protein SIEVE ELEMENT OCCLUSION B [Quillaja saponaria]